MMSDSKSDNPWRDDESGYIAYLETERRLYAWCLVKYGSRSPDEAEAAARAFYEYESAEQPYRGLVFHDEAWCWAMRHLYGEQYWVAHPELEHPSSEYESIVSG